MKVIFDWKNFEFEKPEINRNLVVIFGTGDIDKKDFVLCKYTGTRIQKNGKTNNLVYCFYWC